MKKEQTKKLVMDAITAAVVLGVLVVGYFVFRSSDVTVAGIVVPKTELADQVIVVGSQIDATVASLKNLQNAVETSSAVFSASAFASLQDFSSPIAPEAVGRPDPFVPTTWKLSQKSK